MHGQQNVKRTRRCCPGQTICLKHASIPCVPNTRQTKVFAPRIKGSLIEGVPPEAHKV